MVKPNVLLVTIITAIVLLFAIIGTADYWFTQKSGISESYTVKMSLWQTKVSFASGADDIITKHGDQTCDAFKSHIKAAEAFAILTCIVGAISLAGLIFELAVPDGGPPAGCMLSFLTCLFSMITWAIATAVRNGEFCKGTVNATGKLSDNYKYTNGWYFFVIPWIFHFICSGIAISMQIRTKRAEAAAAAQAGEPTK